VEWNARFHKKLLINGISFDCSSLTAKDGLGKGFNQACEKKNKRYYLVAEAGCGINMFWDLFLIRRNRSQFKNILVNPCSPGSLYSEYQTIGVLKNGSKRFNTSWSNTQNGRWRWFGRICDSQRIDITDRVKQKSPLALSARPASNAESNSERWN
jgi:hypothetical protein